MERCFLPSSNFTSKSINTRLSIVTFHPKLYIPRVTVMDIIYNPFETRLMKVAKARGCVTIGGMSMFIHQGAEQFRIWSGIRPSLNTIRRAVERELSRQSEKH